MKTFTERFFNNLVIEQDEQVTDAQAAVNQLEPESDAGMLDVQDVPDAPASGVNPAQEMQKQQNVQFAGEIQGWVSNIEEFIDYLNGLGEDSLNSKINNAPCDTIFDDIARSETKKIGRIAQDLRSLSESLKSYLIAND